MSQNLTNNIEAQSNTAPSGEGQAVHIGLRLRAVEQSDRSIVSNITGVHLGSGFAFIDFGFIDQSALTQATRAARSGEQANPVIDGRLECRIAMGIGDLVQLARQLDQAIAAASKTRAAAQSQQPDPLTLDPTATVQ